MSEVLSQDQIDELLKAIDAKDEDFKPVRDSRRIKIYDFRRPDKFSKIQMRELSIVFENVARSIKNFLLTELHQKINVHVASVDQLTFEEFNRSLPIPSPCCIFDWLDGYGFLQIDPVVFFNGFLGGNSKKNRGLNEFEKKIFFEQIYKPFEKIITEEIEKSAEHKFEPVKNQKILTEPFFAIKGGNATDMGISVTFVAKIGKVEGFINIFFNYEGIEKLMETNFFGLLSVPNVIPLVLPEPNTIVELGRLRLEDDFKIEPKMIFELNQLAGAPVNVFKNGEIAGQGEVVLIDDNYGVRITTDSETFEAEKLDDFYNAKVILGGCMTEDDEKFEEGRLLELNESSGDNLKLVKDGKVIAYGEAVVIDENFGFKVKKICE